MADETMILTLGKVIIAAAWADGEIGHEEVNSLKDLLFRLPNLTGREWASLEMYIEAPVGAAERERLVEQLKAELRGRRDRNLALQALEDMVRADGVITPEEDRVFQQIKSAIEAVDVSLFGQIGRLVSGPLARRSQILEGAPNREEHFEDFIKNRVFYEVRRRLEDSDTELDVPEEALRKLCLAGGLMARVANVDQEIKQQELSQMVQALVDGWDVSRTAARFVAQVAVSEVSAELDYYRLTRTFFNLTDGRERLAFMKVLFQVAAADGMATHEEIEELRAIAASLKLTHRQFIQAKLTLPRSQRAS